MNFTAFAALLALGLFVAMLACFEAGRRIGRARLARDPEGLEKGAGPVEAAVFGLLGLLLAFTFSGAADRFELRRHLVAEEINAISTAYDRVDLLPADTRPGLRELLREYVEVRATTYADAGDVAATQARVAAGKALQARAWQAASAACARGEATSHACMLLLPALNEVGDMATTREAATRNHPPLVIYLLLAALSIISALLAGYVMSETKLRSWFYMLIIASTMSCTFYVILDLEYPRLGLIRVDAVDRSFTALRAAMH
jgi:hypothetical protein